MNFREPQEKADFSLVLGGPLYQLFLRTRLTRPSLELLHRRVVAVVLVTWLPLLVLTALTGGLAGGVSVPFLFDLDVHVRLLVSLPLLIGAELVVHHRLREVVGQFTERGLVAPEDQPRFDAILDSVWRLRNSVIVEVVLLVFAFTGGYWVWRAQATMHAATWYATAGNGSTQYTPAGFWYIFLSLSAVRFILLRWYFRLFIWYIFLWRMSRLKLRLNALHPDRCGGLGFLNVSVSAFIPFLVAQTVLLAGLIGNQIWHDGATLPEFKIMIAGYVGFLIFIALLPMVFFFPQMAGAKRASLREYGLFACRYVDEFRRKWLLNRQPSAEEMLGAGDIQSLADLGNSYDVVRQMRLVPISGNVAVRLAIVLVLPLLPLTLTMIPLEEMLRRLVKILL